MLGVCGIELELLLADPGEELRDSELLDDAELLELDDAVGEGGLPEDCEPGEEVGIDGALLEELCELD
jgi:hypothetical protein